MTENKKSVYAVWISDEARRRLAVCAALVTIQGKKTNISRELDSMILNNIRADGTKVFKFKNEKPKQPKVARV